MVLRLISRPARVCVGECDYLACTMGSLERGPYGSSVQSDFQSLVFSSAPAPACVCARMVYVWYIGLTRASRRGECEKGASGVILTPIARAGCCSRRDPAKTLELGCNNA